MNRILVLLILSLIFLSCNKEKNPLLPEYDSSKLRIINIIDYQYSIKVTGNDIELCDSLRCHHSSGYIDIYNDTLVVKVFEVSNRSNIVYDTLLSLDKENYYTLIQIETNYSFKNV